MHRLITWLESLGEEASSYIATGAALVMGGLGAATGAVFGDAGLGLYARMGLYAVIIAAVGFRLL